MRLKSFYAKTMTEAMQLVRDELGEDAIIVATREEKGGPAQGGAVRVTAAIDSMIGSPMVDPMMDESFEEYEDDMFMDDVNFEVESDTRSRSKRDWLQYDTETENAPIVEDITDAMLRHGVSEEVMDQILSCATIVGLESSGIALIAAIEQLYSFVPLPQDGHAKALMMVGPPGSGKTLAVAKLAARGTMNGLNVGVVSTDTVRAGGIEQLQSFTDLLQIDLQRAKDHKDLEAVLRDFKGFDQVIIDSAGINPYDKEDIKTLARLIGAGPIEPHLVLPCGMDPDESGDMGRVFSTIGVHSIIPTRIDIARRLGGLLSAAHQGGMCFADASNTPKVADGLIEMSPQSLSKHLMPTAFREKRSRARSTMKAGRA